MNNTIYVGNLPYRAHEETIKELFSKYGNIQNVALIKDRDTGQSKGFGFITFDTDNEANEACKENGTEFEGRSLKVNIARPKPQGDGGRGGRR